MRLAACDTGDVSEIQQNFQLMCGMPVQCHLHYIFFYFFTGLPTNFRVSFTFVWVIMLAYSTGLTCACKSYTFMGGYAVPII